MSVENNIMEEFGIKTNGSIRLIDPVDFLDFLQLESTARLVLTDSGAMHEETCIPGVLTLRDNTGRPVEAGSNVLAGTEAMIGCARSMFERGNRWKNTLGDGRAGERMMAGIEKVQLEEKYENFI
ncbi:MAG: UDP-N-acetylglucosamine 2-epimerase [Euryarchaeota archaeon]|nr:UDP-N-acetylglucosamine 2-epimerase [Euryarchaeota archaeon]